MKSHFYGLGLAEIFVPPRLGSIPTSAGLTCLQFAVAAVATDNSAMTRSASTPHTFRDDPALPAAAICEFCGGIERLPKLAS